MDNQQLQPTLSLPTSEDTIETIKVNKGLRIHAWVGIIATSICTSVWFIVQLGVHVLPWFIYVLTLFLLSLSFHLFIIVKQPRQWFQFHLTSFIVINAMMFFTWIFTSSYEQAWFLYPFFSLLIPLGIHYSVIKFKGDDHRSLRIHQAFFLTVNLLLFFIWVDNKGYPWFIYPLLTTALFLAIHYSSHYYPKNYFYIHVIVFTFVNSVIFFVWATSGAGFPWFAFPLCATSALLLLHYKRYHDQNNYGIIGGSAYPHVPGTSYPHYSPQSPNAVPNYYAAPQGSIDTSAVVGSPYHYPQQGFLQQPQQLQQQQHQQYQQLQPTYQPPVVPLESSITIQPSTPPPHNM